ncbi:hypothetical protein ACFQY7_50895 [Actinomadura luteofluorescens]|uniref:Uncharacterized protein n=1 Tax=Actinomadura luteofluorescens TaxID=46163 RepID=A0A7Y9JFG6_9ACTN|nr:hypothetical protein [Actinomadura luteofluorescens]NYD46506.1 hypothetical protein [Actinomadura luteofluorescens]
MTTQNTAAGSRKRSGWRVAAATALALLLPVTVLAWICVLATPEYGRCLTYGEQCDPASDVLLPIAWWSFWASGAAGVAALLLRSTWTVTARIRPALVLGQMALAIATPAAVMASA